MHIWKIIENADLDYMRVCVLNLAAEKEQMRRLFQQHQALIETILRHDVRRGAAILEDHINKEAIDAELLKKQYPAYFEYVRMKPEASRSGFFLQRKAVYGSSARFPLLRQAIPWAHCPAIKRRLVSASCRSIFSKLCKKKNIA